MRWPIFSIVLFVTAVLQITASRFFPLAPRLIRPDLLALLALFYALYAPRRYAPLSAWIVGFIADLLSLGVPGTFSFSFGLLALLSLQARQVIYPEHPISRIILACCWTFLAHAFGFAVPWFLGRQNFADLRPFLRLSLCIALYTSAFTPLYYFMSYKKGWLGLVVSHRRYRNV